MSARSRRKLQLPRAAETRNPAEPALRLPRRTPSRFGAVVRGMPARGRASVLRLRGRSVLAVLGAVAAALMLAAPASAAPELRVGVGRADITPPTGYYMMGWVRSDAKSAGQHTRLWARVIVLERGSQKVALVAEDLGAIAGGMMADAADRVSELGFSQRNVLDSASHTHSGPTGYFNFDTFNTVFMTINSPTDFQLTGGLDPKLYTFMVRRLALAIRRADADLGPGRSSAGGRPRSPSSPKTAPWRLTSQTTASTRSSAREASARTPGPPAHDRPRRQRAAGRQDDRRAAQVPDGDVVDVRRPRHRHQVPVHLLQRATTTAPRRSSSRARSAALVDVPADQEVVNAYGNTDEGDSPPAFDRAGPAAADHVGSGRGERVHARLARGRRAHDAPRPVLDRRWTRMCWCGQQTGPPGRSPTTDCSGLPQFTGSEEGRGPLFDVTKSRSRVTPARSRRRPRASRSPPLSRCDIPDAVPLVAAANRRADRSSRSPAR